MRTLFIFLLSASTCFGQLTIQQMQPFFNGASTALTTPGTLGATHWWVSSDNPLNVNVTNWLDRLTSNVKTNGADSIRPTNSSTGVGFTGTTYLTNKTIFSVPGNPGSFWCIITPQTPSALGAVDAESNGSGRGTLYMDSTGGTMHPIAVGSTVFCKFAPGINYCVGMVFGAANVTRYFTNNVFISTQNNGFGVDSQYTGRDGFASFYKGKILEIAWWSRNLSDDEVTNKLYQYARSTYPALFP